MGRSMLYNLSSLDKPNNCKPNNCGYYRKSNDKNLIKTLEILKQILNKVDGNACLVIANRSVSE